MAQRLKELAVFSVPTAHMRLTHTHVTPAPNDSWIIHPHLQAKQKNKNSKKEDGEIA